MLSTAGPVFVIESHEPGGARVHPQAQVPGSVIEDPSDGRGSEQFTWTSPDGITTTIDSADPNAAANMAMLEAGIRLQSKQRDSGGLVMQPMLRTCEDCPWQEGCTAPPPPRPPSDTTLIGSYQMNFCDDDACSTDNEIRITAVYGTASGTELGRATYKHGSVNPGTMYTVNAPLIYARIQEGSGQYMLMNLVEEDGFGNNDDWCGDINFYAANNGLWANYPNSTSGCYRAGYAYSASVRYYWTTKY